MKKNIELFIKGFFVGIAKIIPGASGSVLAISFGIYEKSIYSIRYFYKNIKENLLFLMPIGIGVLISISFLSGIINYFIKYYYLPTMLLFLGIMIGSIPKLYSQIAKHKIKLKEIIFFVILLVIILLVLSLFKNSLALEKNMFIFYFWIGVVETITMIVPGVSGTAILMVLGGYEGYLELLSSLLNPVIFKEKIIFFIPFIIGFLIGALLAVKIIAYLFNKHKEKLSIIIFLLMVSSIFMLFLKTFENTYSLVEVIISLLLLIFGYKISRRL